MWICSAFRAITGAKRKMRSFVWPVLQTRFKKSLWLFLSGRIRGLSVPVTQKPLKNDTAKFTKCSSWCSDSSGGENVRKKNSRWARKFLAELCGTDLRELPASPGLLVVVKLPVSAPGPPRPGSLPARWLTPGYSCQVQRKAAPTFDLGVCSVVGIRCCSGSCYCVIRDVGHETVILYWFPTPLREFIINSFIKLFSWEIPDCRPWEIYKDSPG